MFGAILGDIIGSPYEFDMGNKTKDFPLFDKGCGFTDDTVMTIAVADALMKTGIDADDETIKNAILDALHDWGIKYPDAGYGARFIRWLYDGDREPYNSFGNGSAMRVSAAGWLAETLEDARRLARLSAEVTHNHPEGIKGAEAVASAIFLARKNYHKDYIKEYIIDEFHYNLSRTCDEIRPDYYHVESCQQTVPEAITAFLEGKDFEDVIRTAVSLGGDCDTLTAIAGSMAEAYYGVPAELKMECYERLDKELRKVLSRFEQKCQFRECEEYKTNPLYWFQKNDKGQVQLKRPFVRAKTMAKTLTMCAYRYGELSDDRKEHWNVDDENPYVFLKWEKKINCAEGVAFPTIANRYLRDMVQIDWGRFVWKATKQELLDFVANISCGELEDTSCLEDGVEYGVVYIEDVF